MVRRVVLGLSVLVGLVACESGIVDSEVLPASLSVVVASQKIAAAPPADRVEISVRGPAPDQTVQTIQSVPGRTEEITGLAVGTYGVGLEAFAGSEPVWRTREQQATVTAGQTTTVSISDEDVDAAPEVLITSPGAGTSLFLSRQFTLAATASDEEDGDLTDAILWTSSLEGELGTGGSLAVELENPGTHTITASVVDTGDLPGRAVVEVEVDGLAGVGLALNQFSLIPAGTFQMGDSLGSDGSEPRAEPVHTVNITRAFYLQKTEVTQGQWREVMGSDPSLFSGCDFCPVETVSWNDIQEFLARLNQSNPGAEFRLPTEAEWEYAARAGTTGLFGGTGVLDEMGWYSGNSNDGDPRSPADGESTHRVAEKLPNAWGLHDMHGNVWEWVQDWFSATYYSVSPTDDPPGPAEGTERVLRGGFFNAVEFRSRSAARGSLTPESRNFRNGFRLARTR